MTSPDLLAAFEDAMADLQDVIDGLERHGPGYIRRLLEQHRSQSRPSCRELPVAVAVVVREVVDDALERNLATFGPARIPQAAAIMATLTRRGFTAQDVHLWMNRPHRELDELAPRRALAVDPAKHAEHVLALAAAEPDRTGATS